jgi:hypothetical protein
MAMNKTALQTAITAALKTRMQADLNPEASESDFEPLAEILAEEVAGAVIQHILDFAETDVSGEAIL